MHESEGDVERLPVGVLAVVAGDLVVVVVDGRVGDDECVPGDDGAGCFVFHVSGDRFVERGLRLRAYVASQG